VEEYPWQVGTPEVKENTMYVQYTLEDLRKLGKQFWPKPGESTVALMLCLWDNMGTLYVKLINGHCLGYMGK
jgi:hypothetical protein